VPTETLLTPEGRRYAAKQLLRRSGVDQSFSRITVEVAEALTVVRIDTGSGAHQRVVFPNHCKAFTPAGVRVVRNRWMRPPAPEISRLAPDLVTLSWSAAPPPDEPLFALDSTGTIQCAADLPAAVLYCLSRAEEAFPCNRDEHGRFPASSSLAVTERFLERPIVDEYGLALQQALELAISGWHAPARQMRVKVTHDIDLVGLPFSLRASVGHTVVRNAPIATVRDFVSRCSSLEPAYLRTVAQVSDQARRHNLKSAVFWKASPQTKNDSGYDINHPQVRKMIESLHTAGVEQGVHPGYDTYQNRAALNAEVGRLREALGDAQLGGRQHFLRWDPSTWKDWESCGLVYDSSVGYAEAPGFRAGTSLPYRPWLLEENREALLIEIPLILMDGSLVDYLHLRPTPAYDLAVRLIAACQMTGGVFTLLWHNSSLLDPSYGDLYPKILKYLAGAQPYDWNADVPGAAMAVHA
jgi:hypothetical protein